MSNGTILVTGGAGYIGSHVVARLCEALPTAVLDNLPCGHRELVPAEVPLYEVGLGVRERVMMPFAARRFAAVVPMLHRRAPSARAGFFALGCAQSQGTGFALWFGRGPGREKSQPGSWPGARRSLHFPLG